MNLLIINLDKAIFAPNSASLNRLKEYCQLVDKMFVIVWTKKKERPICYNDKLFIYPTNSGCRLFYYLDTLKIAKNILKNHKINLVFTQDPFETGLAGRLICLLHKIKLQLQIHTDIFSPYFSKQSLANQLRIVLAKRLIKKADCLRVVSQRIKASLIKIKIPAEKIFVLPIFTDTEKISGFKAEVNLKKKYPQFKFIFLMAARLSPEKNIGLAIEAMVEIIKKYPQAGLLIVGSGPEEAKLKTKIKDLKLNSNIILEPWTNELFSYYKTADAFLLASNYEGWGMSVIEAMAAGCPVIMTDVGCAGELVRHRQTGLIVPVGEKNALVRAIEEIMANDKLRHELTLNSLAAVKNLSDKKEYLKKYKKSWELACGINY